MCILYTSVVQLLKLNQVTIIGNTKPATVCGGDRYNNTCVYYVSRCINVFYII